MNRLFTCIVLVFLSTTLHADIFGKLGFYASMHGSIDFVEFAKPGVDNIKREGTGFGLELSPGVRLGSFLAFGPFGMLSSIADSTHDNKTYLLSGYGGEMKIRFAPINIKGGYGSYTFKETVGEVETDYKKGTGWHASVGFEALLGPGMTIFLDAKYRKINFSKFAAEIVSTSGILGVTSYF